MGKKMIRLACIVSLFVGLCWGDDQVRKPAYVSQGSVNATCDWRCGEKLDPICATNYKTYQNRCKFNKAKCEDDELRVLDRQTCDDMEETFCLEALKNPSLCDGQGGSPVCGSNRKKYDNICQFRMARCQDNDLYLESDDMCGGRKNQPPIYIPGVPGLSGPGSWEDLQERLEDLLEKLLEMNDPNSNSGGGKDTCATLGTGTCPTRVYPVCGTDGVVYKNRCQLERAQCRNGRLEVDRLGEACGWYSPVICKAIQRQQPYPCTADLIRTCGSDGVLYQNRCAFQAAKCTSPNLVAMPLDRCKDDDTTMIECPRNCRKWYDGCNECSCRSGYVTDCTDYKCIWKDKPYCMDS